MVLRAGESVWTAAGEEHFHGGTAENFDVFGFELTTDEVAAIDGLDTGKRGGPEPGAITLETFGREIPEA